MMVTLVNKLRVMLSLPVVTRMIHSLEVMFWNYLSHFSLDGGDYVVVSLV